nr:hypothetical protein [Actinomycetales bacterium]
MLTRGGRRSHARVIRWLGGRMLRGGLLRHGRRWPGRLRRGGGRLRPGGDLLRCGGRRFRGHVLRPG